MTSGGGAPPPAPGVAGAADEGASAQRGAGAPAGGAVGAATRVQTIAGRTHVGLQRPTNEDAVAVAATVVDGLRRAVAIVCDGIAGGASGDQAALAAADGALTVLTSAPTSELGETALRRAVAAAHQAVCEAGIAPVDGKDEPGTTLVAALTHGTTVDVAWVGDSRAYLVPPDGPAEQLTRDHSWVSRVVDSGELTEEEARASKWAQVITRCIGPAEDADPLRPPQPSLRSLVAAPRSVLVLCSDGMWGVFEGVDAFGAVVRAAPDGGDAAAIAGWLVDRALAAGAEDDITVAVVLI